MIHQLERVMLRRSAALPGTLNKVPSRDPKYEDRRFLSGMAALLDLQRTHGNAFVQRLVRSSFIPGVVARQPKPPDPGWSDAPDKGFNKWVTTVDEKGNIVPGKATSKG